MQIHEVLQFLSTSKEQKKKDKVGIKNVEMRVINY